MAQQLEAKLNPGSRTSSGHPWGTTAKWLSLHLLCTFVRLSAGDSSTGSDGSRCQLRSTHLGVELRSWGENHHRLLGRTHSFQSCWAVCCQDPICDAFWWSEGLCFVVDCSRPQNCQAAGRTTSSNSVLGFVQKPQAARDSPLPWEEEAPGRHLRGLRRSRTARRTQRSFWEEPQVAEYWKLRLRDLPRDPRSAGGSNQVSQNEPMSPGSPTPEPRILKPQARTSSPNSEVSSPPRPFVRDPPLKNDSREPGNWASHISTEVHQMPSTEESSASVTLSSPLALSLAATRKAETSLRKNATSGQPRIPEETSPNPGTPREKDAGKTQMVTPVPSGLSRNESLPTTPALPTSSPSTTASTPGMKELVVSAGESVQVTLPKNEVQLNAFVLPEPSKGASYSYDWKLITHPKDYSGEMEGKHSRVLKLSKLTLGLYEFKVIVDGDHAHGEGYVNVTVNPEPRVNQPPVAIVSPQYQEISLPTTSTVVDGSQSTDDDKIVQYHWEELKGPLREEKVSADTAILKLTNLVPGNYTFSLTVVDSDGASGSTTASLTVNKAVDYPPVANAGPNQVITLPQNSITLYGNQSTDDHGIASYEWSLSPSSKGKVVEMQGVRTSTLQLSAMQEGDYTYQLTVTDTAGHQATTEVTVIVQPENNKPPQADAGPDKELTLPVDSTTLDGSKSTDDQKIVSYLWEKTQGPDGVRLEDANQTVATVTGLQVGTYEFTLTVKDERNLQSRSSVSVIVKEEINKPPVARIAGSVVITLPTDTAELDGSKSSDDKGIVSYLWTRDEGSPAAGEVLKNSDHHPILFLSNLVEGTYTFHLKVTDAKGESDTDRTTVEVKPDPRKNNLVEMILDVNVSQLSERQKGMFIRQIGVLLGVLDSDITVQKIQPYTEQSTKMVFFVQNDPPHQIFKGYDVAGMLKSELRKQQTDFLIFRALEINTVTCQLNCSDHGHCDSFTKRCICDPFWMQNFIKVHLRDGESNCEWSVLYVIIASFVIVVALGIFSWTLVCCCRRRKGKPKRKSKYKILDATDQESLELRPNPRGGSKQKAPILSTSLMHSESELDSDEAIFTWPDREKGKLLCSQNGQAKIPRAKAQREEAL
ncbi:dyslexia-associated protein KIAA0319-like protein homolog isoform X2 [Tachyglossus aculeatus]|uniref:dyslexia-associated protein KIAA0319-like protein homolog isoform X2 n=1 Tax=Tachyglossus aculeatus TaxID=9261 RepID=UPI0018F4BC1F|nr:dyslexia-associated protein KIAA0319-like protein homolog isoform X2 [Tachyglossus aculeatus]